MERGERGGQAGRERVKCVDKKRDRKEVGREGLNKFISFKIEKNHGTFLAFKL